MIIKNYKAVACTELRKNALDILIAGVNAVLPSNILKDKVIFDYESKFLVIGNKKFEVKGNIYVIGFGKASGFMAEQIEKIIGVENIKKGIVIDKTKLGKTKKIVVHKGSHPLPTNENIIGTNKILELTDKLEKDDIVICLISGGGSALLTLPVEGIELTDIIKLTELLLKCGADVFEINIIRKHLSRIKGGKLVKYLHPARTISIIFSDTIDTTYDATASGPTSYDKSTFADAYAILQKYDLIGKIPKKIEDYIRSNIDKVENETVKPNNPLFENVTNFILVDNLIALRAMKNYAKGLGYKKISILTDTLKGETKDMAGKMGEFFRSVDKEGVYIYGGETTVTVKGNGKGGRLQEYIASLIPEIDSINNCVVASFGSDGVDFIDGVGGAIADNNTLSKCKSNDININKILSENNSYELHNKLGNLLKSDPTNTNVADLHVFIKGKN
jgi:glycerate-2-kinase